MATLSQVYINLGIGGVVSTACFLVFGIAVHLEANKNLTPRAWARPVGVIKNCLSPPYSLGWISWAMSLRYIDLLSGIPGTGTRKQGWSGPTLRTNLDGIVLMRYHALQFKVSLLATVLCMFMLLPLYYTAVCRPFQSGNNVCKDHDQHTDFEQLTIANVVPHRQIEVVINGTKDAFDPFYNDTTLKDINIVNSIKWQWIMGVTDLLWHEWIECLALRRVYYLESEYYEERLDELDDIWTNSDPEDPFQKVRPPFLPHPEMRETIPNVSLHSALYKLPSNLCTNFEPNTRGEPPKSLLEHQLEAAAGFFDQCVPAQRGFTSSIAAVTMVPDAKKLTKVWGKWYVLGNKMRRLRYIKDHLECRKEMQKTGKKGLHDFFVVAPAHAGRVALKATTETMVVVKEYTAEGIETVTEKIAEGMEAIRGCGPNSQESNVEQQQQQQHAKDKQPVSRKQLTNAEDMLASVSSKEEEFRDAEAGGMNDDSSNASGKNGTDGETMSGNFFDDREVSECEILQALATQSSSNVESADAVANESEEKSARTILDGRSSVLGFKECDTGDRFEYDEFDPVTFAKWIGYSEETELDQLIDTLEIEQLTVYAREMSQSASNPCVYGFASNSIWLASIEQLDAMLEDAWTSAREANALLLLARAEMFRESGARVNIELPKTDNASMKKNDEENLSTNDTNSPSTEKEKDKTQGDLEANKNIVTIPEDKNEKDEDDVPVPSNLGRNKFQRPNGLRQRGRAKSTRDKYDLAQDLVKETNAVSRPTTKNGKEFKRCCRGTMRRESAIAANLINVLDSPSYCVVTFTCRQAAVAARQCLADGKGTKAWEQVQNIPMYPLADAPPRNIFFCRGCCRPVTLTIPEHEKRSRQISLVSQILSPTWLAEAFPDNKAFQNPESFFSKALAGISSGYIYTLFFSFLPQVFKVLAFCEGTSSSKVKAEENAMRFYWYFMLVTAFTGTQLVQVLLSSILEGNLSNEVKDVLGGVAASMITQQAPVWLNWIIVRTFNTLPLNYLLQLMTFVYGWLRIYWLNRVVRGGGPGGPPPYRIYIDSGVVFMCITSLAPACPIIAPAATLYYIMFIPMLRWLHIFVYRPFYDGGGNRLPVIHEILISSLILGQILLGTILLLKQSFVFGLTIALMPIPTYLFSVWTKEKFQRSYEDAGLYQTSKLDGLTNKRTIQEREKYRRWLVDCHKASYVPICLSGGEDFLTSQPAAVVPMDQVLMTKLSVTRQPSPKNGKRVAQKGAL